MRKRLENFGFLLSHDVDRIAFYHPGGGIQTETTIRNGSYIIVSQIH